MKVPTIKPEWRTSTVVALCQAMREAQDWSALPVLADAVQDAGCPEGDGLLTELRGTATSYARRAALVACLYSDECEEGVQRLALMLGTLNCPDYETVVAAATDNHHENLRPDDDPPGYSGYNHSDVYDGYLHFNGSDAHGAIPGGFWELVELATGKRIAFADRPTRFSCSC